MEPIPQTKESTPVNKQKIVRHTLLRSLSASLTIAFAALVVIAVSMHGLVQAQRVTGSRSSADSPANPIHPSTYLSVISPTLAITLTAHPTQIHFSGGVSLLEAEVTGPFLSPVPDGTEVLFETSLGTLGSSSITKTTVAGVASATLRSGPMAGTAQITATAGESHAYTTVEFIWYDILLPLIARNH
jgi:hypothetical protein